VAAIEDDALSLTVRVGCAEPAAEGIKRFELVFPDGADLPPFSAGAHIFLKTPRGPTRRYSLCNDPHDRHRYEIAVKREPQGGGGSISLVDETQAGDPLLISAPRNDFELSGNPASYLFIAGGIGITPILSMVRFLQTSGRRPYKLYYLTRSPEETAFRDYLRQPEFRGKVVIHHDRGDPEQVFDLWPLLEQPKGAHLYCCGPRSLMQAVRDMTGHWSSSSVHFEDFGGAKAARSADDVPFTVRLAKSCEVVDVPIGTTILEALRARGHLIPSSCESGTCGTCRVVLLAGEPDHRDLALSDQERSRAILVCVSRALSGELVLDL
jgi:phthalate 4,5-dioxygenase reductase subunit